MTKRIAWVGDSISAGTSHFRGAMDGIVGQLNRRIEGMQRPERIENASQGGMLFHNPDGTPNATAAKWISEHTALLTDPPHTVVLAVAANDLLFHRDLPGSMSPTNLYWSQVACINLTTKLRTAGVERVLYMAALPVTPPERCTARLRSGAPRVGLTDPWGVANTRTAWNSWLKGQFGSCSFDPGAALQRSWDLAYLTYGDPDLYYDGLHPTPEGTQLVADAIDLDLLIPQEDCNGSTQ